jgi:tripartite ATP-independent transporter DctM subunit
MSEFIGLLMFPALLVLIATGIPIAFSMLIVALFFGLMRFGDAAVSLFVTKTIDVSSNYVLGAIPLFIFMGAILQGSGVADRLFQAIYMWTRRLPGSLALAAMLMCTVFGAVTGIAGAVETLVGLLALPPMLKHGYDKSLISGTICAGGSLGTAIPPSITVVVLAPIANVSVGDLFAGIMLPGLVVAWWRPELAPATPPEGDEPSFLEKIKVTFVALVPTVALIVTVLGTILAGVATPTEAAACGAFGALVLSAINRKLHLDMIVDALYQTLSITAMIMLIVLAGNIFAAVFYASGGMTEVKTILTDYNIAGWQAIAFILVLAFLGGFMLDLISIVLILIPIAMPLVASYGVNELWFCVLFLIILQTSYLSPPMAPSIFYLRAIAPVELRLADMYRGVVPFIVLQVVTFIIVFTFPEVALWLPRVFYGN